VMRTILASRWRQLAGERREIGCTHKSNGYSHMTKSSEKFFHFARDGLPSRRARLALKDARNEARTNLPCVQV